MNKKDFIKKYTHNKSCINHDLCSTCINPCCKVSGCDALPFDVEPFTKEHIIELIDKGIYSISYANLTRGKVIPVLRSREVGAGVFNFSTENRPCSLLGKNGCTLTEKERPTMALLLIPKQHVFFDEGRSCKQLLSTKTFIKLWSKKVELMEEVVKHYSGGKDFNTFFIETVCK